MKTLKKALAIVLTLCSLTALLTVGAWAAPSASPNPATVTAGSSVNVTATPGYDPWPADLNDVSFAWSTTDTNVTISNDASQTASVYGVSAGTANVKCVITYTAKEDPTLQATEEITVPVTVSAPTVYVTGITVSAGTATATVGVEKQLSASVSPDNATNKSVIWSTDNGSITQDGKLTASSAGTANVTVSALDGSGISGKLAISVSAPAPDPTIAITPNTLSLVSGNSAYVTANLTNADGAIINWTCSSNLKLSNTTSTSGSSILVTANSGITTSEGGTVTATINGTTVSAQCPVTITPNGVKSISVTADEYTPDVGEIITVTAEIKYGNPGETVTGWKYDTSILSQVSQNGNQLKLKAIKRGNSKVTAYANGASETYIDIIVGGTVINPQLTYGNYGTFDGTNPLYFISSDYISNFKGVTVDGYALTNGTQYYSTSSSDGRILIALNPAYLKMLSSANYHTIQVVSTGGTATGYFRTYGVSYNIYGVRTGDDNNIALWVTLCLIGFAGATVIVIKKRKDIFG